MYVEVLKHTLVYIDFNLQYWFSQMAIKTQKPFNFSENCYNIIV